MEFIKNQSKNRTTYPQKSPFYQQIVYKYVEIRFCYLDFYKIFT